jgi:hypothetical protein
MTPTLLELGHTHSRCRRGRYANHYFLTAKHNGLIHYIFSRVSPLRGKDTGAVLPGFLFDPNFNFRRDAMGKSAAVFARLPTDHDLGSGKFSVLKYLRPLELVLRSKPVG